MQLFGHDGSQIHRKGPPAGCGPGGRWKSGLELGGNLKAPLADARAGDGPQVLWMRALGEQKLHAFRRQTRLDSFPSAMSDHRVPLDRIADHQGHAIGMPDQRGLALLNVKRIACESVSSAIDPDAVDLWGLPG